MCNTRVALKKRKSAVFLSPSAHTDASILLLAFSPLFVVIILALEQEKASCTEAFLGKCDLIMQLTTILLNFAFSRLPSQCLLRNLGERGQAAISFLIRIFINCNTSYFCLKMNN